MPENVQKPKSPSTDSTFDADSGGSTSSPQAKLGANHLLEFYGRECSHCIQMAPLAKKLEEEIGVTLTRYEVWHDEENAKILAQHDQGLCGGVPFFINTKTNQAICGSVPYEALKQWALGEKEA